MVGGEVTDPIVERVLRNKRKAVNPLNETHRGRRIDDPKTFGLRPGSLRTFAMKRLDGKRMGNTG